MVIFMDHRFCLCGLSAIMFVVKSCNDSHDIEENYESNGEAKKRRILLHVKSLL